MQQFSLWIQKINKCYRTCTSEYAGKDIWSVLPKFLKDASDETMRTVNALQHFFTEPYIIFGDNKCVSEEDFKAEFKKFCDKNGYDKKDTKWEPNYYNPVFEPKGLSLKRESKKGKFYFSLELIEKSRYENN